MIKQAAVLSAVLSMFAAVPANASAIYSGCLSSTATLGCTSGGLATQDGYANTKFSWLITENATDWTYSYTLTNFDPTSGNPKDVNLILLEVSSGFSLTTDMTDAPSNTAESGPSTYSSALGGGYASLPASFYAVSFSNSSTDTALTITFNSVKAPVWGDFYSFDQNANGARVWNSGFTLADPSTAATDGGLLVSNGDVRGYKILRPDTVTGDTSGVSAVPEPASLVLLGTGLLAAGAAQRRKKSN